MIHESIHEIHSAMRGILNIANGRVEVVDEAQLRGGLIDTLARDAAFGNEPVKDFARWLIWECGQTLGARPASIHELYIACGEGKWSNRTIPAMNMRFSTYEMGRAAIRAAQKTETGAFIFEIARSEMGYTDQKPAEFSASLIAAAIKEGFYYPIFIQGDHFQVKAAQFFAEPDAAIQDLKDLIAEAVPAGYWNIDIDTSTLVELEHEDLVRQQYNNFMRSVEITKFIRDIEPEGVTISLGGEIGEVGEKNSTVEELDAYMDSYREELAKLGDYAGLSKVSVNTGTSHGGIVLPDGSIADVAVDFDTLKVLSKRSHHHGAGGAVQHGASTLPREMFTKFPEMETIEIHLATGFMNVFMDHEAFPQDLKEQLYKYLDANHSNERKEGESDIQFYLKTRKKSIGPYKPEMWALPDDSREAVFQALEDEFAFYYNSLNVAGSRELVDELVTVVEYHKPMPDDGRGVGDDLGLAD